MKPALVVVGVLVVWMLSQDAAFGQEPSVANLKQEVEILKRENELLKRENELLKQELASQKKGATAASNEPGAAASFSVTVDNVEYVYQGMTRNGVEAFVTLLATSKKGEHPGPNGKMTLIDGEGESYHGTPAAGFGGRPVLREGVPVKLVWRFGPNPLSKKGSAPSAKITQFTILSLEPTVGGGVDAIEFRDVPAVVAKPKSK